MNKIFDSLISQTVLNNVSESARQSPRQRKNLNFHRADADPCHRLLNAVEPGSYIPPHRHQDTNKDEAMIVLRGALGVVFFDPAGQVTGTAVLKPGGEAVGVNIPHGVYHSVLGLEPGTVFFEAKSGPYLPLTEEEKSPWAPAEGEEGAAGYYAMLEALFRHGLESKN